MSSPAQILANQENAQLSTGPRTEQGKATAARNSYRHGAYATQLRFASPEREAEYEAFVAGFRQNYNPADHLETKCVNDMARCQWLLDEAEIEQEQYTTHLRTRLTEELRAQGLDPDQYLAGKVLEARASNKTLTFSERRLRHLHTTYYRALRHLKQSQRERMKLAIAREKMEFSSFLDGMQEDLNQELAQVAQRYTGSVSSEHETIAQPRKNSLPPKARRWR